ncbi:uncharacterized protein LOC143430010 [Xylocopa sonorina]|uniref:uncharacterized protein LOC143430010 n=1 Tax=Xylocopa sonorina TaxID=1818115 RepID=UPI00403ADC53
MTRKCVLCKETNYRNTYSFFSAPKDPEMRKKWQNAIGIENYAVTDDTYVCSKHFHKNDIITHWVSGVPPHVISIKYKKCRLRPGAVPGKHYHLKENLKDQNSDDSDSNMNSLTNDDKIHTTEGKEQNFLIRRTEEKLQTNNDENPKISPTQHQQSSQDINGHNYNESSKRNSNQTKQTKVINIVEDSIISEKKSIEDKNSEKEKKEKQNELFKDDSYSNLSDKISESSSKIYNVSEEDETMAWSPRTLKKEKSTDHNYLGMEAVYIKTEMDNFNYNELDTYYSTYNEIDQNEMLFEDLLEVYTEVALPRGWSCLVTSKGHTTTIVYLYMGITKAGMPFTEKQVFVKSDMVLHCAAVNTEINPLIHNLIREGKHLKVQSLVDIEELIDEFDQRTVCLGIYNTEGFRDFNRIKIAYKDGVQWRHVQCPLIVNNDSSRCTKCISLSHTLQTKSKSLVFLNNPLIFTEEQHRVHSIRQKYKRMRRQDHEYELIKLFKE